MVCLCAPCSLQARVQEETSERKNALEAYIYSLRNKLYDQLSPYVTDDAKSALLAKLEEMEVRGGRGAEGQGGRAGASVGGSHGGEGGR